MTTITKPRKIIKRETAEEQKITTILRRAEAIDPYLTLGQVEEFLQKNDRVIFIDPKPRRQSSVNNNFYYFQERDYSELSELLSKIAIKEKSMMGRGFNCDGVKSFNRNVWLDFSRESNAIEGIIDDFSYDLFNFRVKLREQIDTDPDKDVAFDKYEYYKKLMKQCKLFEQNHSQGILVIEGRNKKHMIKESTLRNFVAFKYAYKCAKYDRMKYRSMCGNGNLTPEQVKDIEQHKQDDFLSMILYINAIISGNSDTRFRNTPVYVKGANWTPPSEDTYFSQLEKLVKWVTVGQESKKMSPIEKTAIMFTEFIRIHPFMDGNGRTGRILSNYILIRDEIPTVAIRYRNAQEYFDATNKAIESHDINDLIDIYYQGVLDSAEKIMANLEHIEKEQTPTSQIELK